MKLRVRIDGQPVSNAIVRRLTDYSQKIYEEAKTDENGFVQFPARFERSVLNVLPQEFVVGQQIDVVLDGKERTIWSGVKRQTGENGEGNGQPMDLDCDLRQEMELYEVGGQVFYTNCDWDVVLDPPQDIFY